MLMKQPGVFVGVCSTIWHLAPLKANAIPFSSVLRNADQTLERTDQKTEQKTKIYHSAHRQKDPKYFLKSLGPTAAASVRARNSSQADGWSTTALRDCLVHPDRELSRLSHTRANPFKSCSLLILARNDSEPFLARYFSH